MRGIDAEGLAELEKKIMEFSNNVNDEMEVVKRQFLKVIDSFDGTDLLFLTDKVREELNYFDRIKQNNENYSFVLAEVVKSYHSQDDTLREVLNSITPR